MCFQHDLKQVCRHVLLQIEHFRHSTGEVFHRLASRTTFQALIRSMQPVNIRQSSSRTEQRSIFLHVLHAYYLQEHRVTVTAYSVHNTYNK